MTRFSSSQTILVTGATGYIGSRLVPHLLQKGWTVRCLVRDPARLACRDWEHVEVYQGDVIAPETLQSAFEGVFAAYYLVHSMGGGERGFAERDLLAAQQFGNAARAAGVKRIIYLGGLGSEQDILSPHLKSRHDVGEQLRASGVAVTEFRASVIIGSGNISFELIRYLTERVPLLIEIVPQGRAHRRLLQTAIYEPKGLNGLLYWYSLYPLHRLIFRGLITAVVRKAEQIPRESSSAS